MGAVQQYIDLYRSQKDLINGHSSAVMNGLREEAVSLLESRGLPSLKDEEHRRTDIESVYSPDYGLNLGRIDIETNPYEVFRCDVPNLRGGAGGVYGGEALPGGAPLPGGRAPVDCGKSQSLPEAV